MQVTDLLQAMRAAGYFSIDEIAYAIFETNGQLSVIANQNAQKSQNLPVPVIIDGKWSQADIDYHKIDTQPLSNILQKRNLDCEQIILATVDEGGKLLIHPQNQKFFVEKINEGN